MSRGFTDWTDLGIFPLQDTQEGVPVGMRMAMVAGRVMKRPDPGEEAEASAVEYAREGSDGLGSLGDIHPWFFWQTAEREKRDMGSWSMAWATMVTQRALYYTHAKVQPLTTVGRNGMVNDTRYEATTPVWPLGLPEQPEGMMAMLMPSTNEDEPSKVMLSADRRLVASGVSGPGAAGTTIVDMQPAGELCMSGADTPGKGGRHARLHGLLRVIALRAGSGGKLRSPDLNSLAINYSTSQQDGILGYGMVFGQSVTGGGGGGPTTDGGGTAAPVAPGAPVTSSGAGRSGSRGSDDGLNSPASGGPPPPGGSGNSGANATADEQRSVGDFGSFQAAARGGHAIGLMAAAASGPIGFGCGKHTIGYDADGHKMTSAHIMTDAYFYKDEKSDGPLGFEDSDYPEAPEEHAVPTVVHLSWDKEQKHPFIGGEQDGKWRWWTTVPYVEAEGGDGDGDGDGTGSGGSTPGTPARPGSPTTPGGAGQPGSPPGPGQSWTPGSPPPGGGSAPGSPVTPGGGGGGVPGGPGTGSGPPGPITGGAPNPPPGPPNLPRREPKGPVTPGGDTPSPPLLNSRLEGGHFAQRPDAKFAIKQGVSALSSRGTKRPDVNPAFPDSTRVPRTGLGPAGVISKVGGSTIGRDVGLYSILHPFNTGFAAISFRPQLWVKGAPNFEHNPTLGARSYKMEERTRPSVLTIRAWGAQNESGDWDYETTPSKGRARGGTVKGGILIAPAEFEMEDYLGINSDVDTDDTAVSTFVTFAPTVGAAFGKPTTTGRPSQYSKLIRQNTATGKLAFSEFNASSGVTDIAKMSLLGTQGYLEIEGTGAVKVPSGTTGNRPSTGVATGMVRVNTTTSDFEFYDGSAWQNTKMDSDDQDKLDNITITSAVNLNTMSTSIAAIPADTSARLTALEASAQFQPKAFGRFTTVASPALLATSYNIASVSKSSTGVYAVVIDTDMDTANYTVVTSCEDSTATIQIVLTSLMATTGFSIALRDAAGNLSDASESVSFAVFENNT